MALITSNGQRIRLARRKPVLMRMQGAYQGADGEPGQGLQAGMFSRQPEDSPLRGPYETGCVSPGALCYDAALQRFRADRVLTVMLREEYIPPVTLKQVACGQAAIYGLLTDGTVIMCGSGVLKGESDCELWSGIVHIDAAYGYVVGVKANGSVVVAGEPFNGYLGDFATWSGVVKVSAGQTYCVGITGAGTLHTATYNVQYWKDFAATVAGWSNVRDVSAVANHIVGCFLNGTVAVGGRIDHSTLDDVGSWADVVEVGATGKGTYGRQENGDCLACGPLTNNFQLIQIVSGWTGIDQLAAVGHTVIGLKPDKTVVSAGQVFETYGTRMQNWTGVLQVATYGIHAGRRSCDALASGGDSGAVNGVTLLDHCL